MSLKDKIESDYNNSIKEKDSNSINTLRLIKSAIKDKEISLRGKQDSLTDSDILSLLQSLVKQRKDSIEAFEKANRNDLIENELNDIKVIEMFLPKQMDEDETKLIIKNIIQENNYTSIKELGALMKIIKEKYAGKIDNGAPMSTSLGGRYFHKNDWWDKALMKGVGAGIERDVGCIIESEDGSWGFGFSDRGRITASIIDDYLAPNLVGRSIFETEKIYDMMIRILSPVGSNSFSSRAISAVDLALWDLKGKVLKKPVYELLGGSVIEKLPLYASSNNTEWLKELGFKNFKRFISYGPREME